MINKAILIALISFLTAFNSTAEGFQIPSKDKKIHTLIVTGNYVQSRLLAELVQLENRQPVILVPSNKSYSELFILLPKNALKVKTNKFTDFVNFTGPKQVVFIGDKSLTDYSLVNKLPVGKVKVHKLDDSNLMHTAWQLEELLGLDDLAEDYKEKIQLLSASGVIPRNAPIVRQAEEPSIILPQ